MPKVSLIFLRLPDGNIHGDGFPGNNNVSLRKLLDGSLGKITAVDQSATYTKDELVVTLQWIMNTDVPDQIRTLGSTDPADGDHADHRAAGKFTELAAATFLSDHTITHYMGYAESKLPANLSQEDIEAKQTIFMTYAKFDGAVCQTLFECNKSTAYGDYLARQYDSQPGEGSQTASTAGQ
jgi:hypothetical protein